MCPNASQTNSRFSRSPTLAHLQIPGFYAFRETKNGCEYCKSIILDWLRRESIAPSHFEILNEIPLKEGFTLQ